MKQSASPYYSPLTFYLFTPIAAIYSIVAQGVYKVLQKKPHQYEQIPRTKEHYQGQQQQQDAKPKLAIVTGSNTGIGYETAKTLVLEGYEVILACRSRERADQAIANIQSAMFLRDNNKNDQEKFKSKGKAVFIYPLDLTSESSIYKFCEEFHQKYPQQKIDVLINNAGRNNTFWLEKDRDGCFQCNFLGHYLLTSLLIQDMTTNGRVVNLSSVMHHFCGDATNMDTVEYWKDVATYKKQPKSTYNLSKLAALLFTLELNKRYGSKIRSIAVNPGAVNSDIWRGFLRIVVWFMSFFMLSSSQGSTCSVVAALGELPEDVMYLQPYWIPITSQQVPFPVFEMLGPYNGYCATSPRYPSNDGQTASKALWQACQELTNAKWADQNERH